MLLFVHICIAIMSAAIWNSRAVTGQPCLIPCILAYWYFKFRLFGIIFMISHECGYICQYHLHPVDNSFSKLKEELWKSFVLWSLFEPCSKVYIFVIFLSVVNISRLQCFSKTKIINPILFWTLISMYKYI